MLRRNEFVVLNTLRMAQDDLNQRQLARECGLSVGTVNSALSSLKSLAFVKDGKLTQEGLAALEPYRVNNAIIMAAGLSSRFAPISYEKPKGVLKVRGEALVERQIRQLKEAGITDITVVVGYMKEEFYYLADEFGVEILVNPLYSQRNNNYTLWLVRDRLANTYICSSDDYFTENVFEPYVYEAYYAAAFTPEKTNEYLMDTGGHGLVTRVHTKGGDGGWYMLGHAYFNREFSRRFIDILGEIIDRPETAGKLWEDVYAEHVSELPMYIRHYPDGVMNEFDTLDELRAFDPAFIQNVDSKIIDNIVQALGCERDEIASVEPLKRGLTNMSFKFTVQGADYVYRHPGVQAEELISRKAEAEAEALAFELGIDRTFVYEDAASGYRISRYVEGGVPLDYHDAAQVQRALQMVRTLHGCGKSLGATFNVFEKSEELVALLSRRSRVAFTGFDELYDAVRQVYALTLKDGVDACPCHNDVYHENFLVCPSGDMHLIDWEYAGMGDYASDLGCFVCCSDYDYDETLQVIAWYFGREPSASELRHCLAYISIVAFYWFIWSIYKDSQGNAIGESSYIWYRYAADYAKRILAG